MFPDTLLDTSIVTDLFAMSNCCRVANVLHRRPSTVQEVLQLLTARNAKIPTLLAIDEFAK